MISWVECKQGCVVPAHSHDNAQVTFVISGKWKFEKEGESTIIGPNEMMFMPPNVIHQNVSYDKAK